MIELKKCPVCGSSYVALFLKSRDYFLSNEDFQIEICEGCGFLFTNPRPKDDKLAAYYESEEYISHSNAKSGIINSLYQIVRNFTLGKKTGLIKHYISTGKALDIGCGTGEFLHALSKQGFDVAGIEPNKGAATFAFENYQLRIFDEKKLDQFDAQSLDVITMWHVLEHVPDLSLRIKQIKRLLKPEGIFIVAVPNPASKDAKFYKKHWAAYDLPRHLYHFKKADISNLFKNVGMEIVRIRPMIFDSFYVSLLSEKYKTGSSKFIRPFFVGLWSNLHAHFISKNYSSLIYIINHKNA